MEIETSKNKPNGLILLAGRSSRMGQDKAFLPNQNKLQYLFLKDIISPYCTEVYFSINESQSLPNEKCILDPFKLGPMSGLISADVAFPNHSWLLIACDLAFLAKKDIELLFKDRNKDITCFKVNDKVEPLLAIYESQSLDQIKAFFNLKDYSLSKCIHQLDATIIDGNKRTLKNCNLREDWPKKKSK